MKKHRAVLRTIDFSVGTVLFLSSLVAIAVFRLISKHLPGESVVFQPLSRSESKVNQEISSTSQKELFQVMTKLVAQPPQVNPVGYPKSSNPNDETIAAFQVAENKHAFLKKLLQSDHEGFSKLAEFLIADYGNGNSDLILSFLFQQSDLFPQVVPILKQAIIESLRRPRIESHREKLLFALRIYISLGTNPEAVRSDVRDILRDEHDPDLFHQVGKLFHFRFPEEHL